MSSAPPEPRVRRLENDVTSSRELLGEISTKLDDHDARFDAVDARFDWIDARLDGLSAQVGRVLELLRAG